MTSPLAELLDAVRTNGCLAWLLRHAPDGDADAAVRRAWEGETRPGELIEALVPGAAPLIGRGDPLYDAWDRLSSTRFGDGCTCEPADEEQPYEPCPACCDAIRAAVRAPTWAELTKDGAT